MNIYMKRLKGVDGLRWYFVTKKKNIKYLGSLNSKHTSFNPKTFPKVYFKLTGKKVKVIKV